MGIIPVKTGVAFRDAVVVQTPAGVFTTGLTNASFTKQLSQGTTGNLSTTGLTVTEVSAANNPGVYDILIPSALLATNGSYTLKLYVTADPVYAWSQIYVASEDGVIGSTGTLVFTPVANDGRIEDESGNPIEGATVFLSNSSGYLISATTDASGIWPPVYFDASFGTVDLTVTKNGYSTTASSLTVGASSVTGPGADIAITATVVTGTVAASELWAYSRRMSGNKSGAQADLKIEQAVNDACDHLVMDLGVNGNFYIRQGALAIKAPYATGTLALTQDATTCVLTGGTFPSWAARGRLIITGSPVINVASRTDGTNLVLSAPWGGEATAAVSYTLILDNYALESNAFEFMGVMSGQSWPYGTNAISIEMLWQLQNSIQNLSGQSPYSYAVANNRIHLFPYPSVDAQVNYVYRARPEPLEDELDIADIDPTSISILRLLINHYVALYFGSCVAGSAEECLAIYEVAKARQLGNVKNTRGIGAASTLNRDQRWRASMGIT